MKSLKISFLASLIALLITACTGTNDELPKVNITLVPTIEISQSDYIPLSSPNSTHLKSTNSASLVYAVQILEEGQPYYYGLFDDVSKMEIALTTSKKYTFKVTAYQDGSGSGLKTFVKGASTYYFMPDSIEMLNKFIKGDLLKGISNISNAKLASGKTSKYPEIDVFYQEAQVAVTEGMSSIEVPLKRTSFGLGITVDGLTSGNLDIFVEGDTIQLSPTNKTYFSIRSFTGGSNGLVDVAKVDTYFVSSNCVSKWTGSNSTVVTGNKTLILRRNYQLPLKIDLNTTTSGVTIEGWYKVPINGLVAWYPFNGNANDESGNANNGTVNGATLTTDRFGSSNCAYSYNGINNYISTNISSINGNNITLSAWFTMSSIDNSVLRTMIGSRVGPEVFTGIGYFPSVYGLYFHLIGDTLNQTIVLNKTNYSFTTSTWYHVLGTSDGKVSKLYLNGVLIDSETHPTNNSIIQAKILFGFDQISSSRYWKGKIDDIGIWNRVLTQQEITDLYNAN
jgi:hypothetical protein